VGLGYVGEVTALCLASRPSFHVVGIDSDAEKISSLKSSVVPLYEPGLQELLKDATKEKRLESRSKYSGLIGCEIIFITVGTPSEFDGSIDLTQVTNAAEEIGQVLRSSPNSVTIVVKSTVLPGTLRNTVKPILEEASKKSAGIDFGLASNPEFLAEGSAVENMLHPDRIVVGAYDSRSARELRNMYRMFYGDYFESIPYIETTPENAELSKYVSNALLSLKVSFINEISRVCRNTPFSDVDVVAKAAGLDKRIGQYFLKAGPGWGGSCFGKDVLALLNYAERATNKTLQVIRASFLSNEAQKRYVVDIIREELGQLAGKRIAILGLAFKANTDDVRDSQAFPIASLLREGGAEVRAYDPSPTAMRNFIELYQSNNAYTKPIEYPSRIEDCLDGCDAAVVLTDWDEFRNLSPEFYVKRMKGERIVVDTRRVYKDLWQGTTSSVKYVGLGIYSARSSEEARPLSEPIRMEPSL
jgi:UDPglucose 6-dehydrogenase